MTHICDREEINTGFCDLLTRLLEQEETEDFFYQFRAETDADHSVRTIVRLYPVWAAILLHEWEKAYLLYQRGYGFHEEEPEKEIYNLMDESGRTEGVFPASCLNILLIPSLIYCCLLGACRETTAWAEGLLHRYLEGYKGANKEGMVEELRSLLLDDREEGYHLETILEGLSRLKIDFPGVYQWIFDREYFWNGIFRIEDADFSIRYFELVRRWVEENRSDLQTWRIVVHQWIEEWPLDGISLKTVLGDAWEGDTEEAGLLQRSCLEKYELLFRKISDFFAEPCRTEEIREIYLQALEGRIHYCRETVSDCDFFCVKEWAGFWENRFRKEKLSIQRMGGDGDQGGGACRRDAQ